MMEKTCVVKSCAGIPLFGFGRASGAFPLRWACRDHKNLLNTADTGASVPAVDVASQRGGIKPAAGPLPAPLPAPLPPQGSLL